MTLDEQKKIAKDMGKLYAWQGQGQAPRFIVLNDDLLKAWSDGYLAQCDAMSAAAAKIPLTWPDQRKSGARAD